MNAPCKLAVLLVGLFTFAHAGDSTNTKRMATVNSSVLSLSTALVNFHYPSASGRAAFPTTYWTPAVELTFTDGYRSYLFSSKFACMKWKYSPFATPFFLAVKNSSTGTNNFESPGIIVGIEGKFGFELLSAHSSVLSTSYSETFWSDPLSTAVGVSYLLEYSHFYCGMSYSRKSMYVVDADFNSSRDVVNLFALNLGLFIYNRRI